MTDVAHPISENVFSTILIGSTYIYLNSRKTHATFTFTKPTKYKKCVIYKRKNM